MNILIKNGYLIDPLQKIDGIGDIVIEKGKIKEVMIMADEKVFTIPLREAYNDQRTQRSKWHNKNLINIIHFLFFYFLSNILNVEIIH